MRHTDTNYLMPRRSSFMTRRDRSRGFTLIEVMIVGVLIAVMAGLAIISTQVFYDDGRRKLMFDETKQVGTAVAWAHNDLSFFPRLNLLNQPLSLITANAGGVTIIRPGFDMYGFLGESSPLNGSITNNWRGAYLSTSQARERLSQGSKQLVRMRFPERVANSGAWTSKGIDPTLDWWPADTWGNPYVVYLVSADSSFANGTNRMGLRLITRPNENPDYFAAVVSYGPNGVPGGVPRDYISNTNIPTSDRNDAMAWIDTMRRARLYVVNNAQAPEVVTINDPVAGYTLRSVNSGIAAASLRDNDFLTWLPDSISNQTNPGVLSRPGIKDSGSDDIMWTF